MKPIIALTARCLMNGENPAYFCNENYINAITDAGGIPCIFPPTSKQNLDDLAELADGLLITGGNDLNPDLYKQNNHPLTAGVHDGVDTLDMELIRLFHKHHKPILGICRGLQSLNVAFGGTLIQDLPSQYPNCRQETHSQTRPGNQVEHLIYMEPNSYAHTLFGESFGVNSYHHQAIFQLGNHLRATAHSEDGVIEMIEGDKIVAVQWHPERLRDIAEQNQLFLDFVKQCKQNSAK